MCEFCGSGSTCCVCGRGLGAVQQRDSAATVPAHSAPLPDYLERFFRWQAANPADYRRAVRDSHS